MLALVPSIDERANGQGDEEANVESDVHEACCALVEPVRIREDEVIPGQESEEDYVHQAQVEAPCRYDNLGKEHFEWSREVDFHLVRENRLTDRGRGNVAIIARDPSEVRCFPAEQDGRVRFLREKSDCRGDETGHDEGGPFSPAPGYGVALAYKCANHGCKEWTQERKAGHGREDKGSV